MLKKVRYFANTIHLVTKSDIEPVVIPETLFALVSVLAGPVLTTNPSPMLLSVVRRLPQTILWIYLNLLALDLSNQRLPSSIIEDGINKPWRPIPAGRISSEQVRQLLLLLIPLTFLLAWHTRVVPETAYMVILNYLYNDLQGADMHFIIRNVLNGLGYTGFSSGALRLICGSDWTPNTLASSWLVVTGAIIATTISVQDLRDQEGDRKRNRHSAPLILGENLTRRLLSFFILVWSLVCPFLFSLSWWAYLGPVVLGIRISITLNFQKDGRGDKVAWQRWGTWLMALYTLPLIKRYSS